ncbi:sugar transferase [Amnibacterium sp. CER49]|uniref:sugar transferase n=1 Tax=Amnibacterium sp. CER49 TaxID=3039161 RepID=UPI002447EA78|nr:sugar transferase [Amnibacterium sp. CER49]MDH2442980.1 sugar transferase [Amnibacterium sp. CER49]
MESSALGETLPEGRAALSRSSSLGTAFAPAPGLPELVGAGHRDLHWTTVYRLALIATDAVVVALALLFAQSARFDVSPLKPVEQAEVPYAVVAVAIGVLWLGMLAAFRSRESRFVGSGTVEYQRVAKATLYAFGGFAVVALAVKLNDVSRGYLLIALPVGLGGLLLDRYFWRSWLISRRRAGGCLTGAFVVGSHPDATRVTKDLVKHHHAGYKPAGVAFTDGLGGAHELVTDGARVPLLDFRTLADTVRATHTRAVIVAGDLPGGRAQIQDLGWQLENSKTELILMSQLTDVAGPRIHMRPVDGLPMLHVDLPQYAGFNHTLKRGIDLVLGGVAFLLLSPVLALVALAVRLDSPGPVLFRQERIGVAGRSFTMFKFRSMVIDAEERLAALQAANEGAGLLFKMRDDPRITRVGAFIRRYSLDELPQLFNVLNGTMSLIGPRPPLPREVAVYEGRVNRRLLIKPGITGLWQVSGRSNLSWEESVKLDLYYVENWSVVTDFVILLKTVKAVLKRDGAY